MSIKSICARYSNSILSKLSGESGLALPIVLAVVALGALITAPFLTHASTDAIGSAAFKQMMKETYSAEAGAEHAVWSLTDGNLSSQLVAAGDSASYVLSNQVNAFSPSITVTKISGGSGSGTSGTITKSIISSLQFDATGYNPIIVNVASGIYAVVYRNSSNYVILKTLAISSDGIITPSIIDSLTISNLGYEPDLVNIASGIYAVVYRGSSNKGYIATLQIASNGNISNSLTDQAMFNSSNTYEPSMIHTSGNYYLVVYRGSSNKGSATTLQISASGAITSTWVSTMVFSNTGYEPSVIHVSGNYYAVAFRGASNKGNLVTLAVDGSGQLSGSMVSSLVFNNTAGYTPVIINSSGDTYAIAYRGASNYGYITTVNISSGGIISSPLIDTFKFDGAAGYEPDIITVSNNVYAAVYRGASNDGFLVTLEIAGDGTITQTAIDSFEFDTSNGYEPGIINIAGSIFAVAYRGGTGTAGYVKTIGIASGSTVNTYRVLSTAGSTTITTDVTIDKGVSTVTSWSIDR